MPIARIAPIKTSHNVHFDPWENNTGSTLESKSTAAPAVLYSLHYQLYQELLNQWVIGACAASLHKTNEWSQINQAKRSCN